MDYGTVIQRKNRGTLPLYSLRESAAVYLLLARGERCQRQRSGQDLYCVVCFHIGYDLFSYSCFPLVAEGLAGVCIYSTIGT